MRSGRLTHGFEASRTRSDSVQMLAYDADTLGCNWETSKCSTTDQAGMLILYSVKRMERMNRELRVRWRQGSRLLEMEMDVEKVLFIVSSHETRA